MATLTPQKGYLKPTVSGDVNSWGGFLNTDFDTLDSNLGGYLSLGVGGAVDVTLSAAQAKNAIYNLTGALTGNISVIWPAAGGFYIVQNSTTGAFSLTAKTSGVGSTGPVLTQGNLGLIYSDGTNMALVAQKPAVPFAISAGSANAQTLAPSPAISDYQDGASYPFQAGFTNTGALTINISGKGAKAVTLPDGTALSGNEVQLGRISIVTYSLAADKLVLTSAPQLGNIITQTQVAAAQQWVTFTLPTGCSEVEFSFAGVVPAGATAGMIGQIAIASVFQTGANYVQNIQTTGNGATSQSRAPLQTQMQFTGAVSNSAGYALSGKFRLKDYADGTYYKWLSGFVDGLNTGTSVEAHWTSWNYWGAATSAINQVRFGFLGPTNVQVGNFTMRAFKDS